MAKKTKLVKEVQKVPQSYFVDCFGEEISITEKVKFIQSANQEELINIIDNMDFDSANRRGALSLKSKIKKAVWRVKPGGDSAREKAEAELISDMWDDHGNDLIEYLFQCVLYGFGVVAPIYEISNGRWEWKELTNLGAKCFAFTSKWDLKTKVDIKVGGSKIIPRESILSEDAFHVYTYEEKDNNRYGIPLRLRNYYLWLFYRECLQIWSLFNKKATIPSFIALSDANASGDNKATAKSISSAMRGIKNGVGGVLFQISSIEKLDANPQGYKSMAEFKKELKDEMVQNYTGSTLSTETNSTGSSYNIGELHKETAEDWALDMAMGFVPFINSLFEKLVFLNRPEGIDLPYPTMDVFYKDLADIDTVLKAGAQGAPLKKDVLTDEYKLPIASTEDQEKGNLIYLMSNQTAEPTEIQANSVGGFISEFMAQSKKKR